MVFIHGITASIAFWVGGAAPVFDRFQCISLSLPGHYPAQFAPTVRDGDLTPEALIDALAIALREVLGGQRAHLLGYSTGGWAALGLAARAPDAVASVASVSGFLHGRWKGLLGTAQLAARWAPPAFRWTFARTGRTLAAFEANMPAYTADAAAMRAHPLYRQLIPVNRAFFAHADYAAFARWFRVMPSIDISAWMGQVRAPVLLVHGDADPIVPLAQSRKAARLIAGARLVEVAGAGHFPMLERGAAYDAVMTPWAQALLG
jgi:pimeloyl-ACP methyl ester carboxylesterase